MRSTNRRSPVDGQSVSPAAGNPGKYPDRRLRLSLTLAGGGRP